MAKRPIIEIDRDKCNGCGLCTTACAEGALILDDENKAVLVKEIYCDGLGACLDVCPVDALKVVEKESEPFDSEATHKHVHDKLPCGCPGSMQKEIKNVNSELTQWPIQLQLVSPQNPAFDGCDLLIAADCTAFALGSFHPELLRGKKLVIACPKLDDISTYVNKISELIKNNTIYSLTVAIMSVPCCTGLLRIVEEAVEKSGKNLAIKKVVVGVEGEIL